MNNKFDELTKSLAQSVTRRAALKKFGVGPPAWLWGRSGWRPMRRRASETAFRPAPVACQAFLFAARASAGATSLALATATEVSSKEPATKTKGKI